MDNMVSCRAITSIKSELEQIQNFYDDLVELDKYTELGEYDDADRLRARFSELECKILVDHEELALELDKENTRVDGLEFLLKDILKEQELIKKFEFPNMKDGKYYEEILMLDKLTMGLLLAYKSVRTTVRWERMSMSD